MLYFDNNFEPMRKRLSSLNTSLTGTLLLFLLMLNSGSPRTHKNNLTKPPNIVLIIADDLGYSDLASYGNQWVHTPHIDGLAKDGVRFTQAYVTSPICSPSRAGIMTGRYQNRFGSEYMPYEKFDPAFLSYLRKHFFRLRKQYSGLRGMHPKLGLNRSKYFTGLPKSETTLAELLKSNEYATGLVGKWNLGDDEGSHPYERGFDYTYYFDAALTRYVDDPVDSSLYINQHLPWAFSELAAWTPRAGSTAIREGNTIVKDSGYLTFSLASKAANFIERNKDHPFFLALTFNAPHDPFQVPRSYFDRIQDVRDTVKRVYYGMIEALDDAVGTVLQKIQDAGIDQETLVIFLSDNGGATYTRATNNAPLRGGKCTHFEGGLMVPFFIRFPAGMVRPQVYDKPISSLDIFATVAALTHTALPSGKAYDGTNLVPYLASDTGYPHRLFFWRSGYSKAICKENWKLYVNKKSRRTYLFDLSRDLEEKHDLSEQRLDKVKELSAELENWEKNETMHPAWPSAADLVIEVDGESYYFPS
jgi:arylsulfatase A-like enzyme